MAPVEEAPPRRSAYTTFEERGRGFRESNGGRGVGETAGCHGFASGAARRKWLEFWCWFVSGVVAVGQCKRGWGGGRSRRLSRFTLTARRREGNGSQRESMAEAVWGRNREGARGSWTSGRQLFSPDNDCLL